MPEILAWTLALRVSTQHLVETMALDYGLAPRYAACICQRESGFDAQAVGDQGKAVGLWQWHLPAWQTIRRAMSLSEADERADAIASTQTALWALQHGYAGLWSTAEGCKYNE